MNKLKRKNGGITLIALVVTIIVLLILARNFYINVKSAIIGILQKATDAKKNTERADAKEQAQLDILAWQSDKIFKGENSDLNDTVIKGILTGKSYVKTADATSFTTKKGEYEISYSELYKSTNNNNDVSVDTEYPYRTPYIPTGFSHTGTEDWNHEYTITGKTGTNNEGDEFVWVPCVLNQAQVKTGDTVQTFGKITTLYYNIGNYELHPSGGKNIYVEDEDPTVAEIRTSVETYGGFYIAKYEAGIVGDKDNNSLSTKMAVDGSVKPLSQAGKGVWNAISREDCLTVSKAMIPASTGTKSSLISGECWDTTLAWIAVTADATYAEDENKGWYGDKIHTTGFYGTNTNNIFDMGGNVWEKTSENGLYDDGEELHDEWIIRGGSYKDSYDRSACHRNIGYKLGAEDHGFRVVLYK